MARQSWLAIRRGLAVLTWLLASVAGLAAAQNAANPAAHLRIGYVDMQRLIDSAPQVAASRARLQGEFAARDSELETDSARLKALETRLQQERTLMSSEQIETLEREADALRHSIERTRERLHGELNQRIGQELDRAWPVIESAVADYAREAGYDLVLSSPVVYAGGRIDITDRVLDRLRQQAKESTP